MKIGFWTLGMPPWSNDEVARRAAALGYDGVDLRCTRPENGKPADNGNLCIESTEAEVEATKKAFADADVEISSLLGYNRGGHGGQNTDWDALEAELVGYTKFATRVGAPRVRITVGRPDGDTPWETYLENLWKAVQNALVEAPGVGAVFENHVGSGSATQLLEMSEKIGDPRIGVHFSPDHCLVMQEDSLNLIDRYAPWIHQVCIADRKVVQEDLGKFDGRYYYVRYETCWNGDGIVPAAKIFDKLAQKGYDGYISLKWEKSARFGLELPEGDLALAHFIGWVKSLGVKQTVAASR